MDLALGESLNLESQSFVFWERDLSFKLLVGYKSRIVGGWWMNLLLLCWEGWETPPLHDGILPVSHSCDSLDGVGRIDPQKIPKGKCYCISPSLLLSVVISWWIDVNIEESFFFFFFFSIFNLQSQLFDVANLLFSTVFNLFESMTRKGSTALLDYFLRLLIFQLWWLETWMDLRGIGSPCIYTCKWRSGL